MLYKPSALEMEVRSGFKVTLSYIVQGQFGVHEILFQKQNKTPKREVGKKGGKVDSQDVAILEVVTVIL